MATAFTTVAARAAVVTAALCATTAALPLSAYAEGGTGTAGVTLAPAHTTPGTTAGRSYFVRRIAAGRGYGDAVTVTNLGAAAITLDIATVRATTASSTGVVYAKDGGGDARWVRPAESSVGVPAHRSVTVPFEVRVPAGARPGEHLSGIAFTNPDAVVSTRGQLSVRTVYRNVIGVQTDVAGAAAAHFTLPSASLARGAGTGLATLTLRIANDGRLFDHGRLSLRLTGAGYDRTEVRSTGLVLAGDTIDLPTLWPTNLTPGRYGLVASLSGTDFPTATLRTTLTLSDTALGGAAAPVRPFLTTRPSVRRTAGVATATMVSALAAALLIGAVAVGWVVAARRRRRDHATPPGAASAATPDRELLGV